MSVQTKLSQSDKVELKEMRARQNEENPHFEVFHFPERRITVGVNYVPGHNAARVFISLASPEESKFRKKVGEYCVRLAFDGWERFCYKDAGVPFAVDHSYSDHFEIAETIADTFGSF